MNDADRVSPDKLTAEALARAREATARDRAAEEAEIETLARRFALDFLRGRIVLDVRKKGDGFTVSLRTKPGESE